ncbi:leukocyte immunoglobulin-like receptor subfamily A member 2 [Mirounga angustirostris]|uniref:leukocyte immunoglobulin-like receptor subfamily A member 2 n=1 Tax=Mirounga angustirostris TaxID=9716 RepID=UPI00313BF099
MGKPPAARILWVCQVCQFLCFCPSVQPCPVGGSAMTITFTVLLCFGLCLGQMTHVQADKQRGQFPASLWTWQSQPLAATILLSASTNLALFRFFTEVESCGMFNKPNLSALPSPIVTSGGSVTLQCGSWQDFDWFVLCSEGGEGHPRHLDSQHQADGWFQALFTVDHVSPSHRRTYRCYDYFLSSPYVWSTSSHILELLISGEEFRARS